MTPRDVSIPALVFKKLPYPLQAGAIGVTRTLGRWGVPVYIFGEEPGSPLSRSRYATGVFPAEGGDAADHYLLDRLLSLPGTDGAVLVPVDDPGALFVADHAEQLRCRYRLPHQPAGLTRQLADKRELSRLATDAGLAVPEWAIPLEDGDVSRFVSKHGLPVVVKAGDPERLRREEGMASVAVARSESEAIELTRSLIDDGVANALLQEYIPGGPETVWMVNACIDSAGTCTFAGVGRKIRQYPVGTGATTLGITEDNPDVLEAALRLLAHSDYRGAVDMGLRWDHRDGQYKVLDVNPRVGATFRLFAGEDGMDVIRALYLDLTGQGGAPTRAAIGRHWWLEPWDAASALTSWRAGDLKVSDYLRSLRHVDEAGLFARDDPRPLTGIWRVGSRRIASASVDAFRSTRPVRRAEPPCPERDTSAVAAYFDRELAYWDEIYDRPGVDAEVYRERLQRTMALVDGLDLRPCARVLEVGSGAGYLTSWLVTRGFRVDALDSSPSMSAATRRRVGRTGHGSAALCFVGDAHHLPAPAASYDLVVALGLLPWVSDPSMALKEMARVIHPDGLALVSFDNRWNMGKLFDPRISPVLLPAQIAVSRRKRAFVGDRSVPPPAAAAHSPAQGARLLEDAGLAPVRRVPVGFGPFTLGGIPVLTARAGLAAHRRLQRAADAGGRVGGMAAQYLVLARRAGR